MTDTPPFPRRDPDGRIPEYSQLLAYALLGFAISIGALAVIDGAFALLGFGEFGDVNGWLALIFPAIVFVEQFRVAGPGMVRVLIAAVSALIAFGLGALGAGLLPSDLPSLVTGGAAALLATVAYSTVWHVGVTRAL